GARAVAAGGGLASAAPPSAGVPAGGGRPYPTRAPPPPRAERAMPAPPEESWRSRGHAPKPRDDSAGTAEAEVVAEGERRMKEAIHIEDPRVRAIDPAAAAKQRGRKRVDARPTRSPEATDVPTRDARRGCPVRAGAGEVRPVRHPLLHVPHHVEHAPARLAARSGARVHRVADGRDVAVRRPVVRPGVRGAG